MFVGCDKLGRSHIFRGSVISAPDVVENMGMDLWTWWYFVFECLNFEMCCDCNTIELVILNVPYRGLPRLFENEKCC